MSELTEVKSDTNWGAILLCTGIGIAGLAIGTFLLAPGIQKMQASKKEKKDKAKEGAASKGSQTA